jgi:tripartite-type tricarboxylate transporter receptor subunit TctC
VASSHRRGTPRDVIVKVNEDAGSLAGTDVRQRTAVLGFRLPGGTADKLRAMLNDEIDKWATLAKNGSIAIK